MTQGVDSEYIISCGEQQLPLYPKDPIRPMSAGSRGAHCVPQESRLTPPAPRESKQGMSLWNFWPPLGESSATDMGQNGKHAWR
jgi:hypothetical protein